VGITAGSREVPGRNACDKRHPYRIIIITTTTITTTTTTITTTTISFMQGIYTYIPETKYVPREFSVAPILLLLFMVLISLVSVLNLLYFYISTFRSMCAVPNMAVSLEFLDFVLSWYTAHIFSEGL